MNSDPRKGGASESRQKLAQPMAGMSLGHLRGVILGVLMGALIVAQAQAATFAAYVMDARTGETLFEKNADKPLPPASLTKMMTLYITFQEIEAGRVSLDTMITVSKNAANQAPSRLGLKAGQKIALRYLIRGAAVKSANDCAAAIGDYFAGSPEKWGKRMTQTAKALGMKHSTFKNANGLPTKGHLSTAHDMSILGRRLFYDFPQYYNIFSRRTTDAGMAKVANTNRKFLDAYEGADGIKTGYTGEAGFNLTASAERSGVRIIATVFGETSTDARNRKMAELLDLGFKTAKPGAAVVKPDAADPEQALPDDAVVAEDEGEPAQVAMGSSPRPKKRPATEGGLEITGIEDAVALANAETGALTVTASAAEEAPTLEAAAETKTRKAPVYTDQNAKLASVPAKPEVVTRVATSGGAGWGINIGRYPNSMVAEKALIQVRLLESAALDGGTSKVVSRSNGYDAVVLGLTRDSADLACRKLQARAVQCFTVGE
jgi:D-alanyl-D-alanine carboxypeptidase